jgi:glyoxylase-like metal-dependent hydrolase (beta-lactamase superfamily II)
MPHRLRRAALALLTAAAALSGAARAQTPPEVTLTRLDCGTAAPPADVGRFSDTFAHRGLMLSLTYSCYLIRHGDQVLLWDTGQAPTAGAVAPKMGLADLLAQLQLKPEQVTYVGISHYHPDHTGQLPAVPQATLLIGRGDWAVVNGTPAGVVNPAPFAPWLSGGGKVEPVPLDKDVFGDGTVLMLATPGHTPGHHSLLVRLKQMGDVFITGDLAHFRENFASDGVPPFNTGRAESLASLARAKQIVANLKGTVIIQHDVRDVDKLPAFPAAAR